MYKKIIVSLFFLTNLLIVSPLLAQDSLEGKFTEIKPALPTQTGDKIEVIEIFWYGCPHCYSFEPHLEAWLKEVAEDVQFVRVPGVLNQGWIPHAKAYYIAEKLGIVDKVHRPIFDAIHKDRNPLNTEKQLMDFFTSHGVSSAEFTSVFNSKEIDTKIRQAYFIARDYKLTGVPTIVVNGKYRISASDVRSFEEMIVVTSGLIEKER